VNGRRIEVTRSVIRVLLAIVLCTAAARAESGEPDGGAAGAEPAGHVHHHDAGGVAEGGHHGARHHVMVMAAPGVADVGGEYFDGGVGYEYRLPHLGGAIGIGAMAELMFGTGHGAHPMLMATVSVHPFQGRGLYLLTALGASHAHGDGDTADRTGSASSCGDGMSLDGIVRLSAGYDVHAGSIMVTPHVNADFGGSMSRAVSVGLGVGRMF
jgi:hypothetical protein